MSITTRGILCTLIGGSCWGFSGACSQYLFTHYALDPGWLGALRMFSTGVLLLCYCWFTCRARLLQLVTVPKNLLGLLIFAVGGLMSCQYAYLQAIANANAATATVLQNLLPVLVLFYVCCSSRRLPDKIELLTIILAVVGTFLIATHGELDKMVLTPAGLTFGLLSAVTAALYSLLPRRLIATYGSVPVVAWGMLFGGLVMSVPSRLWFRMPPVDGNGIFALVAIVLIGTLIAFTLYLQGVSDIGPVKASMLASSEPLAATLLAIFWLDTPITFIDIIGFIFIIATVFILALKR